MDIQKAVSVNSPENNFATQLNELESILVLIDDQDTLNDSPLWGMFSGQK